VNGQILQQDFTRKLDMERQLNSPINSDLNVKYAEESGQHRITWTENKEKEPVEKLTPACLLVCIRWIGECTVF
jgi:hypothetical protein